MAGALHGTRHSRLQRRHESLSEGQGKRRGFSVEAALLPLSMECATIVSAILPALGPAEY